MAAVVEHEPQTEPRAERPPWTAVLHDWVTTVDHKKIGLMYILMAVCFLVIGGIEALLMRWQLLWPRHHRFLPEDVFNQMFTHPRHHDGLLHGHADPDRHRQLHGAADDRRPRHGLSAAQYHGLLGDAVWRLAGLLQFRHRRCAGHRLVRLAPLTERTFARSAAVDFGPWG